jgi:hypothetical protein
MNAHVSVVQRAKHPSDEVEIDGLFFWRKLLVNLLELFEKKIENSPVIERLPQTTTVTVFCKFIIFKIDKFLFPRQSVTAVIVELI